MDLEKLKQDLDKFREQVSDMEEDDLHLALANLSALKEVLGGMPPSDVRNQLGAEVDELIALVKKTLEIREYVKGLEQVREQIPSMSKQDIQTLYRRLSSVREDLAVGVLEHEYYRPLLEAVEELIAYIETFIEEEDEDVLH